MVYMETSTMDSEPVPVATTTTLSSAVVRTVAAAEGVDVTALPPLFHAIDPDALDALFRAGPDGGGETRTSGAVTFSYHGYEVTVDADGSVDLAASAPR